MKIKSIKKEHISLVQPFIFCAASGTILACAFLNEKMFWLAFIALMPFFWALLTTEKLTKRRTFAYTMIFSLFFFAINVNWIYELSNFSTSSSESISMVALSVAIVAVSLIMGLYLAIPMLFFPRIKSGKWTDIIKISMFFIVGEWFHQVFYLLSFPWGRIAAIVTPFTAFIQSADLFGSLGVSFLVLVINGFLCLAIINIKEKKIAIKYFITALLIFTTNILYGIIEPQLIDLKPSKTYKACIVQGNFSDSSKWNTPKNDIFELYIETAKRGIDDDTDFVFFPETAFNFNLLENHLFYDELCEFTKENDVTAVFGFIYYDEDENMFNSMAALTPDGKLSKIYSKQILVPFGETVPFKELLALIIPEKYLERSSYTEGDEHTVISADGVNMSGIICYESIFPSITRKNVAAGGEAIAVLSNDSWFGESAALYQHHAHAILRAVENRRYVIRCSNTAITSVISPYGEVEGMASKYTRTVLKAEFYASSYRTIYNRTGDIIVIPCIALMLYSLFSKKKKLANYGE